MLKTIYQSTVIAAFGLMLLWLSLSGYFNFLQVSFGLVSTFFVVWLTYHLNLLTTDGARSQILRGYPLYLLITQPRDLFGKVLRESNEI